MGNVGSRFQQGGITGGIKKDSSDSAASILCGFLRTCSAESIESSNLHVPLQKCKCAAVTHTATAVIGPLASQLPKAVVKSNREHSLSGLLLVCEQILNNAI